MDEVNQHPGDDVTLPAEPTPTAAERRAAVLQWLLPAVPFPSMAWWHGAYGRVLGIVLIALPIGLIGRYMPDEMKRNPRVWVSYQVMAIVVASIAAMFLVLRRSAPPPSQ